MLARTLTLAALFATAGLVCGCTPASAGRGGAPAKAVAAPPSPFERGGLFGYRDAAGLEIIPPRFSMAEPFTAGGIAYAADERGWVALDARGREILRPYLFDNGPDPHAEGLARFVERGKIGFYDESGRVVVPARLDFARPFSEGLAAFCTGCRIESDGEHQMAVGGVWGYIDRSGHTPWPPKFEHAESFQGGKAQVRYGGAERTLGRSGDYLK